MKPYKISLFLLLLFASQYSFAQIVSEPAPEYKSYHWDSVPRLHELSPDEQKMGMVVIQDKRLIEYYQTGSDVVMYVTRHLIIRVNSDKAVEETNTVYIPLPDGVSLVDMEARAIGKDGKVTMLNPANIKDVDNYENHGHYRIFAIDGIEIGGEVEYIYTVLRPTMKYGTEYIQVNSVHKLFRFDIYSPPNLIFESKSYNGFPSLQTDTTITSKHHIYAEAHDVKGFDREEFSLDDGALMRMEYKFTYNTNVDPNQRLDTWSDFCQSIYTVLNKGTTKDDRKIARKVADTMLRGNMSEEDKIRKIESRMKNIVSLKEYIPGKDYAALKNMLKNHVADEIGMLKLYDLLFDAANIKHELVMTSNRFDKPFDGDFDSWTYLQKYMYWFPDTKNYMAPLEPLSRYGYVPPEWICQQGLFIHPVTIGGDFTTDVGQVREISCNDWKQSTNDLFVDTKFDFDMGVANIHLKETFTGYEAYQVQPFYVYSSDQDRKDFIDRLMKSSFEDAKPANTVVTGYSENDLLRQPFVIETDISTNSVLEQTGNKFLFKIGELIGPQSELYRDTTRHTDIENHYNHGYHRVLSFEVPEGYKVTNLDAVNMDVFHSAGGERDMEFHSSYTTDGNKVTVTIDEDYREIRYPVSMYEDFRKVINASADFNKVVLFIE